LLDPLCHLRQACDFSDKIAGLVVARERLGTNLTNHLKFPFLPVSQYDVVDVNDCHSVSIFLSDFGSCLRNLRNMKKTADSHKKEHKNTPEKQQPRKPALKQEQSPSS